VAVVIQRSVASGYQRGFTADKPQPLTGVLTDRFSLGAPAKQA
jgi:hypothetical protein